MGTDTGLKGANMHNLAEDYGVAMTRHKKKRTKVRLFADLMPECLQPGQCSLFVLLVFLVLLVGGQAWLEFLVIEESLHRAAAEFAAAAMQRTI